MNLTAVVLNHLPEQKVQKTLASLSFADEILIVHDQASPYPPIISKGKIKVYQRLLNQNYADQRNFAIKKAKFPWILFIDSDETVSSPLRNEIKKVLKNKTAYSGFYIKRQDIILNQTLKHGETANIKLLRLAQKNKGRFTRKVHEKWLVQGRVGELKNPIYHHKNNFTSQFLKRIKTYGLIDAQALVKENKPFSKFRLIFNPPGKFLHNYIVRHGLLDGYLGLFHAYLMSIQSLSVRIFQWSDSLS